MDCLRKYLSYNNEIIIDFFTKCNLNCDFCFQNHTNDIDIEAIKNIPKLLEEEYLEELKNANLSDITICIKGGELFSDDIPDSMFDLYEEVCNNIITSIRGSLPNIIINIECLTNGVYTKHNRVLNLFNNIKSDRTKILFSYDPIGRFKTKKQFKLFEDTFNHFYYHNMVELSITLTKTNINSIIYNKDFFINNIQNNILIGLNLYIPNKQWKLYQPSDDDLFNFYKWGLSNNKFNINLIRLILDVISNNPLLSKLCTLNNDIGFHDKRIVNGPLSIHYFDNSVKNINDVNYPKYCWCDLLLNDKNCYINRTIRYLYDHPEIKERYNEYKNRVILK
jgi:hypothetical protein